MVSLCRNFFIHFERSILKKDIVEYLADVRQIFKVWLRECGIARIISVNTKQTFSGTIAEVCKALQFSEC